MPAHLLLRTGIMTTVTRRFSFSLDTNAELLTVMLTFVTSDDTPPVVTATANGITGTGASQHEAIVSWLQLFWGLV